MKTFTLHRQDDETGVSGTGVVAWGVRWPDGSVSIRWNSPTPSFISFEGVPSDAQIQRIGEQHIRVVHGHNGKTAVIWKETVDERLCADKPIVQSSGSVQCDGGTPTRRVRRAGYRFHPQVPRCPR
jgi:hypothetical protein